MEEKTENFIINIIAVCLIVFGIIVLLYQENIILLITSAFMVIAGVLLLAKFLKI